MKTKETDKSQMEKIDKKFFQELKEISIDNTKVSMYQPSIRRLTKGIRKHSLWKKIKEDIRTTPLLDDRWKNDIE